MCIIDRLSWNARQGSNFGTCVSIIAPGDEIPSAFVGGDNDEMAVWTGTSMATPHVSGAVAQLLQQSPQLTPIEIKQILEERATEDILRDVPRGTPNRLLAAGAALLDLGDEKVTARQIVNVLGRWTTHAQWWEGIGVSVNLEAILNDPSKMAELKPMSEAVRTKSGNLRRALSPEEKAARSPARSCRSIRGSNRI